MNHVRTDPACVQHAEPTEETRGIICRLCVDLYHHRARGDDMTEQQTPTPIDPADIRPGDVVERRNPPEPETFTIERIAPDGCLIMTGDGAAHRSTDGYTWHLVSRPDPDAEAVQAIRSASYNIHHAGERMDPLPGLPEATDLLTKLREQGWDVVRRQP